MKNKSIRVSLQKCEAGDTVPGDIEHSPRDLPASFKEWVQHKNLGGQTQEEQILHLI